MLRNNNQSYSTFHFWKLVSLIAIALPIVVGPGGGCAKQDPNQRWVNNITIHGNQHLSRSDILKRMLNQPTSWYWWVPFLGEKHRYDPVALEGDIRRIIGFYQANGFFRAQIVKREVTPTKHNRSVNIALFIDEGKASQLKSITIKGLEALPDTLRPQIVTQLPLIVGARFDHTLYDVGKSTIYNRLKNLGYTYAKVEGKILVNRDQSTADVQFSVWPGPRVKFKETRFINSGNIPVQKLKKVIPWQSGDYYSPTDIRLARGRLLNLQVFSSVEIILPQKPTPQANVKILLSPTQLRELRIGFGLGLESRRQEIHLSGNWTWRNFLGGLRTLNLRLQPAWVAIPTAWNNQRMGPAVQSNLRLNQPFIFNTQITAFTELGYDIGIQEGYQYHGPHLQAGLERPFLRNHLRAGLSWNLQFYGFFNIDEVSFTNPDGTIEPTAVILGYGFRNPYRLAWLEEYLQLDWRDDLLDPRAGFFAEIRLEEGIPQVASDFTYFKVTPLVQGYIPLFTKRFVLALRTQFGLLQPRGNEESPVTRRLFLGGPNSHRGFSYGRLSPQAIAPESDTRIPLGGNASFLASADLRFRLTKIMDHWLGITAFIDAGDVVPELAYLDLTILHWAVGLSLQYDTPIGAIRAGVGFRLNRLEEMTNDRPNPDPNDRYAIHITLGEAF